MPTVRELATEFGVSPGFVVKALQRLAVYAEEPASNVSEDHAQRFRDEFGPKIKKAKPKAQPLPVELPERQFLIPREEPRPQEHIIRVAHDKVDVRRNMITYDRYPVLAAQPGLLHSIDPVGTRSGDP